MPAPEEADPPGVAIPHEPCAGVEPVLTFRSFHPRLDRLARERFVCTEPDRKLWRGGAFEPHPRGWELDVQSWLRSGRQKPHRHMIVGVDPGRPEELASMMAYQYLDRGDVARVLLDALAVAMPYRRRGGHVARADQDNDASERLLVEHFHFEYDSMLVDDEEFAAEPGADRVKRFFLLVDGEGSGA